jgi:hypothetical protein
MVSIEIFAIIISVLGLAASLFYYANTIRNATKARQAQVYVQLWNKFNSPEFFKRYFDLLNREWDDYDDWVEKYGKQRFTDIEKYSEAVSLGTYFEGVGVLLKNGFIDIEPVVDLLGTTILLYWDKMRPIMKEYRVRNNSPRAYLYAEYLYDKAKPILLEQHPELTK